MEGNIDINEVDQRLVRIFLNNFSLIFDNYKLSEDITSTQSEIINVLSEVVENRSEETANHINRVSEICYIIADKYGLPQEDTRVLKLISPLHDVGKIAIPDNILKKPGKLTDEEFDIMKRHAIIGYNILQSSKKHLFKQAAIIAKSHHERWDGKGYPNGISGEDIPLIARIVAVADVFDALLHKRVYKDAWDINSGMELFEEEKGKQFDPKLVEILMDNLDEIYSVVLKYTD
jgi:response regulator RpfG family c-di-GMP phosphodiesterase